MECRPLLKHGEPLPEMPETRRELLPELVGLQGSRESAKVAQEAAETGLIL
jgi:hypothetical protein